MEIVLYITIPALLVLLTAYFLINKLLKSEEQRRNFELRKSNTAIVTPIRLRAYERFSLVLERTIPQTIVLGTIKPGMNCLELQTQLLSTIRHEFDHNVSQQIYVSNELWSAIKTVRESLLRLVNGCAAQFEGTHPATELAEKIIQVYTSTENTPGEIALSMLKNEVRNLF
jgi:hypothetical protein